MSFLHHFCYPPHPQLINPIQLLSLSTIILAFAFSWYKKNPQLESLHPPFFVTFFLFTAKKKRRNRAMAHMMTTALFFAFLAISINAQAPVATPEASPELAVPTTSPSGIAETPEAEPNVAVPRTSPSFSAETPEAAPELGVPITSISIAATPGYEPTTDAETPAEALATSPNSIAASPYNEENAPSLAPDTTPSTTPATAPGSESNDFADGPIADSPDITIESPPSPPEVLSDAPATAPSSPSSGAIRTGSGFAFVGLVASVLVVVAF